jgi:hypothetical protein
MSHRKTTIYIASSWKNQHAVEMLTNHLRLHGFEVRSFVENNYGEGHRSDKGINFEEWVNTQAADSAFMYDMQSACTSDITIYLGPSGKDAAAESAMAFAKGKYLYGLWAKGEDMGLMRKMMHQWFTRYTDLLEHVYRNHPSTMPTTHLDIAYYQTENV